MPHVLNKLTGVAVAAIKAQLAKDADAHAKEGMCLEHVWTNADDAREIFFLFRVDDVEHCKALMKTVHAAALKEDPSMQLPEKIYLEEV